MHKSVLVAALSVALISTGLADPDRGSSKGFTRGHRNAESGITKAKATVIGANINVRSGPNANSDLVKKVSGASGIVLAQSGDWVKVKFQYGTIGWVRQDFLKISGHSAAKMIPIKLDSAPVVATKSSPTGKSTAKSTSKTGESLTRYVSLVNRSVNIHRGPSASNSVAHKVHGGKALVLDKRADWYQVRFQYGTEGWVKADAVVFPSNFDFKNSKNKRVVQSKQETFVAAKTATKGKPEHNARIPENTVEIINTGERTTIPAEEPTPETRESSSVMATVIGDGIAVRKGPSKSNSALTKVNGGKATIVDHRGDFYQLRFEHGTVGWVHSNYVSFPGHIIHEAPPIPVVSNDPDSASRTIVNARKYLGVKYVYGGTSRYSTDCSGFTLQVFKSLDIHLPRTAAMQSKCGTRVTRAQLQTGDLVFFNTRGFVSHVGIYIGESRFIHASSGKGHVTESSLNETYYGNKFLFGSRILSASKVKKLDLPSPGQVPPEKAEDRDDNKVDIVKGTGSGRD